MFFFLLPCLLFDDRAPAESSQKAARIIAWSCNADNSRFYLCLNIGCVTHAHLDSQAPHTYSIPQQLQRFATIVSITAASVIAQYRCICVNCATIGDWDVFLVCGICEWVSDWFVEQSIGVGFYLTGAHVAHAQSFGAQHRDRATDATPQSSSKTIRFTVIRKNCPKNHQLLEEPHSARTMRSTWVIAVRSGGVCVCACAREGCWFCCFSGVVVGEKPARRFARREPAAGWGALHRRRRGRPWPEANRLRRISKRMAYRLPRTSSCSCWVSVSP